ncbi:MAG: WD40/YVTN/BNR-like repeat-containing protein, partial [Polyangia bacterium]
DSSDFVVQTGGAFDCVSGTTALAPSTACTVRVVFSPTLAGARKGTVVLSATPGGSAGVSMSGTGVCPADQLNDGTGTCVPTAGLAWTPRGTTPQYWSSVASSADGTKLVAAVGDLSAATSATGYIYTSTDSGVTWVQRGTIPQDWMSLASSADGTKLGAAVGGFNSPATGYYIYTSADSGVTWMQTATQQAWSSVASSSDGTKLVAVVSFGYIFTSADSGATWTQTGTQQWWSSVASSSDGTKLVAAAGGQFGGYIYTSSGLVQ